MLFYEPDVEQGLDEKYKSYLDDNNAIRLRTIDTKKYNGLQCVCRAQVRSLIMSLGTEIGLPTNNEAFFEAVSDYYSKLQGDEAIQGGSDWLLRFIATEFGDKGNEE